MGAASSVSDRCVYAGVVEHSVYVHPQARGPGHRAPAPGRPDHLHRGRRDLDHPVRDLPREHRQHRPAPGGRFPHRRHPPAHRPAPRPLAGRPAHRTTQPSYLGAAPGRGDIPSWTRSLIPSLIQLRPPWFTSALPAVPPQVADGDDPRRTPTHRLGKRVGGNPSRVRISYPPRGVVCDETAAGWRRGRESPSSAEERRSSDPPFSQRQSGLAVTHQHLDAHVVGARVKVGPYPAGHLIG